MGWIRSGASGMDTKPSCHATVTPLPVYAQQYLEGVWSVTTVSRPHQQLQSQVRTRRLVLCYGGSVSFPSVCCSGHTRAHGYSAGLRTFCYSKQHVCIPQAWVQVCIYSSSYIIFNIKVCNPCYDPQMKQSYSKASYPESSIHSTWPCFIQLAGLTYRQVCSGGVLHNRLFQQRSMGLNLNISAEKSVRSNECHGKRRKRSKWSACSVHVKSMLHSKCYELALDWGKGDQSFLSVQYSINQLLLFLAHQNMKAFTN